MFIEGLRGWKIAKVGGERALRQRATIGAPRPITGSVEHYLIISVFVAGQR